jgi:hypothetical protein
MSIADKVALCSFFALCFCRSEKQSARCSADWRIQRLHFIFPRGSNSFIESSYIYFYMAVQTCCKVKKPQ